MLDGELYKDACVIIDEARQFAYRAVNVALTLRNWKLGERITREHLDDDGRAEYGKHVIEQLAAALTEKYGKGFDKSSLHKYVKFYNMFPEIIDAVSRQSGKVDAVSPLFEKVDALSQQLLPWTLYRELIRVEDAEARKWYAQRLCARHGAAGFFIVLLTSQASGRVWIK